MNFSRSLGHFLESRQTFLGNIVKDLRKTPIPDRAGTIVATAQFAEPEQLTIPLMMNCSMHIGHSKSYWNPAMAKYILGERHGVHVIDLDKTLACLRQACTVVSELAMHGGKILFVGTGQRIQRLVYETALFCNQYYVNRRWIGGTITNGLNVLQADIKPDLVIIFDLLQNTVAAKECYEANVPVIAICDTNCDPKYVTYPIPSNDESLPAIELIARSLALAAKRGEERRTLISGMELQRA